MLRYSQPTRPVAPLLPRALTNCQLLLGWLATVLLVDMLAATLDLAALGWLAGLGYATVGCVALTVAVRRTRTVFGPADRVTLTRAVLIGGVTALVAAALQTGVSPMALVSLTAPALVLDAADGYVARRTGTSSFGARFDMETDAYLLAVLSLHVSTLLGGWVLAIGAMRYAFGLAGLLAPWLRAALPRRHSRKVVAAVQGVVLAVASAEVLPLPAMTAATAAALAALVWSFGRDVHWLWRARS